MSARRTWPTSRARCAPSRRAGREGPVVFVTTDPERDTPERLRSWLDGIDSSFIGALGPAPEIDAAQRSLGDDARAGTRSAGQRGLHRQSWGPSLGVHPGRPAHVVYPMGIQRDDLAADIPLLRIWPAR